MYILLIQQPQPLFLSNRRGWFAALILTNHMNDKLPICNNLLHNDLSYIWFLTLQYLEKKLKVKKEKRTRSVCALRWSLTGSLTLILYYQGYKVALHMQNNSIC